MSNKYVYPAVFHPNGDGSYTITFPDLPGCVSEGKNLENALFMSEEVLKQHISVLTELKEAIPKPSAASVIEITKGEFVNLVRVEIKDERAVRRTISLPKWMDEKAAEEGISLSRIVQDTLSKKFA